MNGFEFLVLVSVGLLLTALVLVIALAFTEGVK